MSSILKALKKLEEEKALRRDDTLDLPREILTSRREKHGSAPLAWGAAFFLALLLTIGLTTLVVSRRADHQPASMTTGNTGAAVAPSAGIAPQAETAGETVPVIKAPAQRPPATPPPDQGQIPEPAGQEQPAAPPVTLRAEDLTVTKVPLSLPATSSFQPVTPARKPALATEQPETALTVSGIAWNKDSADRLAIINGLPTAIGSAVNGFVVEEILPDRVRFSAAGKIIEIPIGKSGKSN